MGRGAACWPDYDTCEVPEFVLVFRCRNYPQFTKQNFSKSPVTIELTNNLTQIGISAPDVLEYAKQLSKCWFDLGEQHLNEANAALAARCERAAFSRSYYAAYNASKAMRYIAN